MYAFYLISHGDSNYIIERATAASLVHALFKLKDNPPNHSDESIRFRNFRI